MTLHPSTNTPATDARPEIPVRITGDTSHEARRCAEALAARLPGRGAQIALVEDSPDVFLYVRATSAAA